MERRRVGGRFVREGLDGDVGAIQRESKSAERSSKRALKPKECRTFTRKRVAEALPEIVKTFVEEAKKGSIAHAKLLTTLGGLDRHDKEEDEDRPRGKSPVRLLIEKMARESKK